MDAISCLAPPPPAALLATSFADAAIARALHFSSSATTATTTTIISPDSSSSHHNHLFPVPPHAASCRPVRQNHHHHHHHQALAPAPAGARAGKRRSRASKRAPTTYISTDAANFRLMVQQITGAQAADGDVVAGVEDVTTVLQVQAAALLGAAAGNPELLPVPVPGDDEASALRRHQLHPLDLQQQQQPCFPTLDSWNVMYETNSSAGML